MRVYLDVSCLNRPFDDQRQPRIRLEAEAVTLILKHPQDWTLVSSQMAELEISAIADADRRRQVWALLPPLDDRIRLTEQHFVRAAILERFGFKTADALHVAAAESLRVDVLLTCDDRLIAPEGEITADYA